MSRTGQTQTPYLEWTLVIIGAFDGDITHELDNGDIHGRSRSRAAQTLITDCIESPNVKNGNVTTIVFRTPTNGRVY